MKITKARLKQIIKEEMDLLEIDDSEEQSKMGDQGPGKLQKIFNPSEEGEGNTEEEPEEEYEATGREKKAGAAVASGGKLGQEEFKGMLTNLLKSKKVMPADRKAVLSDMFGSVGAKIHQALLAEK